MCTCLASSGNSLYCWAMSLLKLANRIPETRATLNAKITSPAQISICAEDETVKQSGPWSGQGRYVQAQDGDCETVGIVRQSRWVHPFRVPTDEPRKISMIFQWYFKTKIPNFHDNSECYKMEKHRTTCYTWSPHTSDGHYCMFLRKSAKLSYLIWLIMYQQIMCMWNTYLFTHVVSQNYVYFIIQWFFQEQLIQNSVIFPWFFHFYKKLFKKFNDFSMILKQIWISMIFQELWEPCHSKTRWVDGTPTSEVTPVTIW